MMDLWELKVTIAVGGFANADQIFDLAEDENTPDDILEYLVENGRKLPRFDCWNFSSIAEHTLRQKRLRIGGLTDSNE